MFFWIIILLIIISVLMAFFSLKKLGDKREIEKTKKELLKGKIIFKSGHSELSSGSSSS